MLRRRPGVTRPAGRGRPKRRRRHGAIARPPAGRNPRAGLVRPQRQHFRPWHLFPVPFPPFPLSREMPQRAAGTRTDPPMPLPGAAHRHMPAGRGSRSRHHGRVGCLSAPGRRGSRKRYRWARRARRNAVTRPGIAVAAPRRFRIHCENTVISAPCGATISAAGQWADR